MAVRPAGRPGRRSSDRSPLDARRGSPGEVRTGFGDGLRTLGVAGLFGVFVRAYTMGGGTYTGIEAVSNGLPIMREPKVETARRTMVYIAVSATNGCEYCTYSHTASARKQGMSDEQLMHMVVETRGLAHARMARLQDLATYKGSTPLAML